MTKVLLLSLASALVTAQQPEFIFQEQFDEPIPIDQQQFYESRPIDPTISFNYGYEINDADTGDAKTHQEALENGVLRGSYSVVQPDGKRRIVEYEADEVSGFQAKVRYETGYPIQGPPQTRQSGEAAASSQGSRRTSGSSRGSRPSRPSQRPSFGSPVPAQQGAPAGQSSLSRFTGSISQGQSITGGSASQGFQLRPGRFPGAPSGSQFIGTSRPTAPLHHVPQHAGAGHTASIEQQGGVQDSRFSSGSSSQSGTQGSRFSSGSSSQSGAQGSSSFSSQSGAQGSRFSSGSSSQSSAQGSRFSSRPSSQSGAQGSRFSSGSSSQSGAQGSTFNSVSSSQSASVSSQNSFASGASQTGQSLLDLGISAGSSLQVGPPPAAPLIAPAAPHPGASGPGSVRPFAPASSHQNVPVAPQPADVAVNIAPSGFFSQRGTVSSSGSAAQTGAGGASQASISGAAFQQDSTSSSFHSGSSSSASQSSNAASNFQSGQGHRFSLERGPGFDQLISSSLLVTNENLDSIDAVELASAGFDDSAYAYRLVPVPVNN